MLSQTRFRIEDIEKAFWEAEDAPPADWLREVEHLKSPARVVEGTYRCSPPLIRPSKLTSKDNGGVGKNLSEGWNLNFAVGCVHACPFCYVDSIHKRFGNGRYGEAVQSDWGDYFLIPENLMEAIERTPWHRWKDREVMMSSTHDPYLPKLTPAARIILRRALDAGVRICLQTRSFLVTRDFDLLAKYPDQIRLQVSISTLNRQLARRIEPRVPPPEARLEVLRRAKAWGLKVGVIVAPVFPPTSTRPDYESDLRDIAQRLKGIGPDHVYGESLHIRGANMKLLQDKLGEEVHIPRGFDRAASKIFHRQLDAVGLEGTWWPENHR